MALRGKQSKCPEQLAENKANVNSIIQETIVDLAILVLLSKAVMTAVVMKAWKRCVYGQMNRKRRISEYKNKK